MGFEFATAQRILFGAGCVGEVRHAARHMGTRALIVTGRSTERARILNIEDYVLFSVAAEPGIACVREGVQLARAENCDVVIGVGGGSAIDAGKAVAALMTNSGEPLDYLEVIGRGLALEAAPAPFIAVPTTAGTGSEATRNAVLSSSEHRVKASLRSAAMLPRLAAVDPELALQLPRDITAYTGLDALTQLIEPYTSVRANPITDALCLDGIRRIKGALRRVCRDGSDLAARTEMALGSLYSGMALANAGLGAVHGFAAALGAMFAAPHGALCAALLPYATEINIRALHSRGNCGEGLRRYAEIARILADDGDLAGWLRALCEDLGIPPLRTYGVDRAHAAEIVAKASQASSMKSNPIVLTHQELTEMLLAAI